MTGAQNSGYMVRTDGKRDVILNRHGDAFFSVDTGYGYVAAKWADRAGYLNDVMRQYTNAARLWAKIDALPGYHLEVEA